MSIQDQKNQERMNKLIEEFNEKNARLSELKLEKDRLAMETVPGAMLWDQLIENKICKEKILSI